MSNLCIILVQREALTDDSGTIRITCTQYMFLDFEKKKRFWDNVDSLFPILGQYEYFIQDSGTI